MSSSRSTFSLLGDRYLDTQFDRDYIDGLERELARRGVVGLRRWILEFVAAGGLWWNVIWWEWCDLDERDVQIGWLQNLVLGACISGAIAHWFGWLWAAGVAVALLAFVLWSGFSLRGRTCTTSSEA